MGSDSLPRPCGGDAAAAAAAADSQNRISSTLAVPSSCCLPRFSVLFPRK